MAKISVEMELERETKGSILYKADYNDPIQNIYVKKSALTQPFPQNIVVTVETKA